MSDAAEKRIAELEGQVADLTEKLAASHHMLYFVLTAIGEPVEVNREVIARGVVEDTALNIEEMTDIDALVFSVRKVVE